MSPSEIEKFLDSEQGKDSGLSRAEAKKEGGINTGRDSARALLRMIPSDRHGIKLLKIGLLSIGIGLVDRYPLIAGCSG
jgi:hypothetical protein